MSVFVVDASVVLKWFIPEVDSPAALRLLDRPHEYLAPDLLFAEIGHVIVKKVRGGQLSRADGERLTADLSKVAIVTVPCRALAKDAYALATATGRSMYDAMYLALAVRLDTQMITADEPLVHALAAIAGIAPHITSIAQF